MIWQFISIEILLTVARALYNYILAIILDMIKYFFIKTNKAAFERACDINQVKLVIQQSVQFLVMWRLFLAGNALIILIFKGPFNASRATNNSTVRALFWVYYQLKANYAHKILNSCFVFLCNQIYGYFNLYLVLVFLLLILEGA
jgi:hypothetical protein